MSFVTENMMKTHFQQLSRNTVKLKNLEMNMVVYRTPKGLVFELEEMQYDTPQDDNFVSIYQVLIPFNKIVNAPEEPIEEEEE